MAAGKLLDRRCGSTVTREFKKDFTDISDLFLNKGRKE